MTKFRRLTDPRVRRTARYKTNYVTFREGKDICFSRGLIEQGEIKHGAYYRVTYNQAEKLIRLTPFEGEPDFNSSEIVVRITSPQHLQFSSRILFDNLGIVKVCRHRPAKIVKDGDKKVIEFPYPIWRDMNLNPKGNPQSLNKPTTKKRTPFI